MIERVTFADLFPRVVAGTDGDEPLPGIVRFASDGPCWVCGRATPWASLAFEAPVCSAVCDDIGWTRYFWALRAAWRPAWYAEP